MEGGNEIACPRPRGGGEDILVPRSTMRCWDEDGCAASGEIVK